MAFTVEAVYEDGVRARAGPMVPSSRVSRNVGCAPRRQLT